MPIVQFKQELSMNDLLGVVEQFSSNELEEFIQKIQLLKNKKATKIASKEAELIKIIQRNFTEVEQSHFDELVEKRQAYTITDEELMALIEMTDYSEQLSVERVKALGKLSKLTGKSVDDLMEELKLNSVLLV
jgi:Glu-tRNA(Gln) amidotransferase subunit E-like FAD-binding protein